MAEGEHRFCVIVPGYQEEGRIGKVVEGIRRHCRDVVVVDDGSTDGTAAEAERAGAAVLKHGVNKGKGAALNTGFKHAIEGGYEFAITMDADGQHDPDDIPVLVEAYTRTGTPVIIGNRMDNTEHMPWLRRATNVYMSWLLSRRMGQRVPDTQSGYRLFRCDVLAAVTVGSSRFAAESEILLSLSEKGLKIGSAPIKVIYRDEKSKIHPIRDTVRFYAMLNRRRKRRENHGDKFQS